MKIQYINEMADFCETSGADIYEVAQGMGLDSRIGAKFLVPAPATAVSASRRIRTPWLIWVNSTALTCR